MNKNLNRKVDLEKIKQHFYTITAYINSFCSYCIGYIPRIPGQNMMMVVVVHVGVHLQQ